MSAETATYCEIHTDVETGLRCIECDRYMCAKCAVHTPVGYKCAQCVRQQDNRFFQGTNLDYLIVAAVAALGGFLTLLLLTRLPFGFFIIFIGAAIGGAIGQAALRITKRRRGRYSGEIGAGATVLGGVIAIVLGGGLVGIWGIIGLGIIAATVYTSFKVRI